jgi:hypothetical protein
LGQRHPRGCLDRGHREQVCEDIANSVARFARLGVRDAVQRHKRDE